MRFQSQYVPYGEAVVSSHAKGMRLGTGSAVFVPGCQAFITIQFDGCFGSQLLHVKCGPKVLILESHKRKFEAGTLGYESSLTNEAPSRAALLKVIGDRFVWLPMRLHQYDS